MDARRRIPFYDYASIYTVPGLYERVFSSELRMRSYAHVVRLYAEALERFGRLPADERALDLGAGNGLGGEELRKIGLRSIVGVDIEPQARVAAARDRPGVYDGYLVGDLATVGDIEMAGLRAIKFTAVVAFSVVGPGHAQPSVFDRAFSLLSTYGLFVLTVKPFLLPESRDLAGQRTGYPDFLGELLTHRAEELARDHYVHRLRPDGSDDFAVALVGRKLPRRHHREREL